MIALVKDLSKNVCDLRKLREDLSGDLVLVGQLLVGAVRIVVG